MSFTSENRGLPLWETVSYHDVPMFRVLALALDHAQEKGARFAIFSADRRDAVLTRFNKRYGTHLHGQAYLVAHQNDPGFFPANPPDQTSHCLFSDGNPAYRLRGRILPARAKLPRYFLGIDAADKGPGAKPNDCSMLIGHLERLGYHVTRPYHSGSEAHHFVFTSDPTPVLRHWKRIQATAAKATAKKPKPIARTRGTTAKKPVANAGPIKSAAPASLSPAGARFIAGFEGFRSKLYNDPSPARNATVGFGHMVHAGPITGKEPQEFRRGITKERGLELLRADAGASAKAVKRAVNVPLNQPQFDALVSFTFNLGEGNLQQSTLLKKLNAGQYTAVPQELKKWVKASGATLPGLVKRRNAEGVLFSSGKY
jgi:lysozyme